MPSSSKRAALRSPFALAVSAALLAAPAAQAQAQTQPADSVAVRPAEPLFTARDAWFAGGFLLGTAALAPLDIAVAEMVQDSSVQVDRVLSGTAGVFRVLGFPGVVLVSGGLYAVGRLADRPSLADAGLHTTEAILVAEAVTITGKLLLGRARPRLNTEDPFNFSPLRGFTHDDYQSFPSGHSTAAFATAAALTTEISMHYPRAKWWVGTLMFTGAGLVAVSRLYHNEHWASDTMMGAAIGSFGGWKVVRYTHSHPDNRVDRWLIPRAALPGPRGGVTLVWLIPTP